MTMNRGKYFNMGCVFFKNNAGTVGGVLAFQYGVNCTNTNCNFTQNTGNFKVR